MDEPTLRAAGDFEVFSTQHLAALGLFVVGAVVLVVSSRRRRGGAEVPLFSRVFAVLVPLVTIPVQVFQFLPGEWDFDSSLPLQLCDFAWVAATIALWTHARWAVALTYFWGITLTTQGMITPDTGSQFPEPRFLMFWMMHMLIVWAALYLTLGKGIGPSWREYRIAVAVTFCWLVAVFSFNVVTGANYGYVNRKPEQASALDLLGPWPAYLVLEIVIIAAVWALMTWPWARRVRAGAASSPDAGEPGRTLGR